MAASATSLRGSANGDLTGLANRVAWSEALEKERPRRSRYRRPVVVMSVDVDGLKQANDRFGHDAGDELLRGVAGILRRNLRDADVVAASVATSSGCCCETQADAMPGLVDRIQIACAAWRGTNPDLRLSGLDRLGGPEPFGDLREALRTADDRMYLAKRGLTSGYHAGMPYDYRTVTVESVTQEADAALARADALVERAVASRPAHLRRDPSRWSWPAPKSAWATAAAPSWPRCTPRPRCAMPARPPRKITKWRVAIAFREDVYRAVAAFAETPEARALTGERARLLEHWMRDFRRAGTS